MRLGITGGNRRRGGGGGKQPAGLLLASAPALCCSKQAAGKCHPHALALLSRRALLILQELLRARHLRPSDAPFLLVLEQTAD